MSGLVDLKNEINKIYSKYAVYINPTLKFVLALMVFFIINTKMGYMDKLNSGMIVLMVALFCSFMPLAFMALLETLFILGHFYALSLEVAIVAAVVLFLMYILFVRFTPKESVFVLLMPVFFVLKIPYFLPVLAGLIGTPISVISIAFGVVVSYLIEWALANESMLQSVADENMVNRLRAIVDAMLGNKAMICMIISFAIVVVAVYTIRKLAIKYNWLIAIFTGVFLDIVFLYVFMLKYNLDYSVVGVMMGNIIAALLAMVVEFFIHNLDYRRTEKLQFEDDEYYYYVRAVPKMGISPAPKRTPSKTGQDSRRDSHTYKTANGVRRTT